jgi:DNA-binding LacI/PurR family transcriptional regulator
MAPRNAICLLTEKLVFLVDSFQKEIDTVLADKGVYDILYAMSADSDFEKSSESLKVMDSLMIPYIMIDPTVKEKNCNLVATDNFKGGYLATKHLIELGHTTVNYF